MIKIEKVWRQPGKSYYQSMVHTCKSLGKIQVKKDKENESILAKNVETKSIETYDSYKRIIAMISATNPRRS